MATAPLITHGVKVDLPKMEESDLVDTKDTPPIIASIDAQGKYYVSVGTDPEEPMYSLYRLIDILSSVIDRHKC